MGGAGDYLEQIIESLPNYQGEWSKTRTLKLATAGLPNGLICHYWYIYLDKKFSSTDLRTVAKKMLLTQLFCSPVMYGTFLFSLAILNQWSTKEAFNNTSNMGPAIIAADLIVWPAALMISFYFLPPQFRVLYDSCITLGFSVFLSYIVHKDFGNK